MPISLCYCNVVSELIERAHWRQVSKSATCIEYRSPYKGTKIHEEFPPSCNVVSYTSQISHPSHRMAMKMTVATVGRKRKGVLLGGRWKSHSIKGRSEDLEWVRPFLWRPRTNSTDKNPESIRELSKGKFWKVRYVLA